MTIARGSAVTTVNGSGPTLATASYNQAAGEHICVAIGWEHANGHGPSTVTDTAGNTYVPRTESADAAEGCQIFDCVAPCLGNASNVITATWGVSMTFTVMIVDRYTTSLGTTVFKATTASAGAPSTHAFTAAFNAGDFAIGVVKNFSGLSISSNDSGWSTNTDNGPTSGLMVQDRIDSPGGTYAAGVNFGSATEWTMAAASYTETGGGGGPTPTAGAAVLAGISSILGLGITPRTA